MLSTIRFYHKTLSKILLVGFTCFSFIASMQAYAADLPEIEKKGVITVATEDDYAPFNFMKNGKPDGFHKDLMVEFEKYMGKIKVKQDILPWTGLLASVVQGQYDFGYTGAVVTEERLKVFNFVAPFGSAQHFYVKRSKDNSIKGVADLNGKTFGIQAGSALVTRLPELVALLEKTGGKLGTMVEYQYYPEAYADLANGRLDYVINVEISINDLVAKRGNVFAKGEAVSGPGFLAWPVPKESPALLAHLTKFINEMDKSGKLAELQEKWFGGKFALPKEAITSVEQYRALTGVK